MAGTGLPIPQSGVLAQGPGVVDGDRISTAQQWAQIARAGASLADTGARHLATVEAGQFADRQAEAERKKMDLVAQHQFDPVGFQKSWSAFSSASLGAMPGAAREKMKKVYDGYGNDGYGRLLDAKLNQERRLAGESLSAKLSTQQQDLLGLAASGRMNTPEFAASLETYNSVGKTLIDGKFIAADAFEEDKHTLLGKAVGEGILHNAEKTYAQKGLQGALADTDALLSDPKSGMSPGEQRSYFDKVRSRLGVLETQRKVDLTEVRAEAEPTLKLLREGVDGYEGDGELIAKRYDALGSPSDAAKMRQAIAFNRGFQGAASLPTREWATTSVVDKIIGVESGGNAAATNPRSTATGLGQFTEGTWLATLASHRPDLAALPRDQQLALRTDPAISREMTTAHTNDNSAALKAAGLPVRDGTVYLAHFAGVGGATALLRADPSASAESVLGEKAVAANPFLRGKSASDVIAWADRKMGDATAAAVDPAMLAGRRAGAQKVFDDWAPKAKAQFVRWGIGKEDVEFVRGIAPYLDARRRGDLRDLLTKGELATAMNGMQPGPRAALLASLEDRAADGDIAARTFVGEVEDQQQFLAKKEKEDPLGRARDAGWIAGPVTVDWNQSQEGLTATLTARARDTTVTASQLGQPVVAALREDEAKGLATVLSSGPADRTMPMIRSMQGALSPEQFSATMAMPAVKDALGVMARSGESSRMSAAFSAYDAMYRANPAEFEAKFGSAALDKLQTWQGKLSFYSPEQIAQEMQRADDPTRLAARKAMETQGKELVKTMTPNDLAGKFGSWLSTPGLSPDALQNNAMLVEYQRLYAERYADTGDAATAETQALERLGNKWGVSSLNGGRLTQRPPERYYPAVQGSHDWMKDELETALRNEMGIPLTNSVMTTRNGVRVPSASLPQYGLVADPGTEADISAGRSPSYAVWTLDKNGQIKVIEGPDGKPRRFAWDREAAVEVGRESFGQTRAFMQRVREGQALDRELNPRQWP